MSRATAVERVREAQTDWDKAIRAHEQVMPELAPFAARLRETSNAAAKQAAASSTPPKRASARWRRTPSYATHHVSCHPTRTAPAIRKPGSSSTTPSANGRTHGKAAPPPPSHKHSAGSRP